MESQQFGGIRVLLVDDDPVMLRVSAATLGQLGVAAIEVAESGRVALELVDGGAPDVIFCDLDMPEMDGIEFLRHVVERNYQGAMVLISGSDGRVLKAAEQVAKARQLKTFGTIEKPLSRDQIAAVLQRVLLGTKPVPGQAGSAPSITVEEIRSALTASQFQLFYQPKVDVDSLRPVGAEALLRWFHPTRGLIAPAQYLPLAESSGCMSGITDWVVGASLRQLADWQRDGHGLGLAINLSMRDLDDAEWPSRFFNAAASLGVELTRVTFELTESAAIGNLANSLEALTRLRLKRVNLSIDDFGTGFSSLKKLTDIPFTELKIDRQFIQMASFDPGARAVAEACADLARELSLKCVAEGVETSAQLDFVRALGCHEAQGFLFAPALPNPEFLSWCRR